MSRSTPNRAAATSGSSSRGPSSAFAGRWLRVVAVAAAVVVVAGCADDGTVRGAERSLRRGFLDSLDEADLAHEVERSCHYDRETPDEPWHFAVHVRVFAELDELVGALAASVDVIEADRDPVLLQQHAGEPQRGWTGTIAGSDRDLVVSLVKNNVDVADGDPGLAWASVCPESRPDSGATTDDG